ncbi:hypothetical protein Nepgr_030389 [Nepenthes gracilis]|uniref:UBC core domain-containing protein n=1 Tax=Nepenthes gracilis TaxID=150966 RepID=A0AAD3Y6I2_NEPGR|nr:hypothetical protein Nepgr_030389 [Nepenthes gracilis]
MAEDRYNLKNPAVKRILQEVKEMQSNPSDDFMSLPLEENIFEWQFAIRGPGDTEFEGGIYHGRIQLPAEYPLKPPSFMLLTPNGRFETQTKICLSISNHHPEHWQPSWSVRTALVALIAFMPTNPNGALGSLEYKKEERRALAIRSREASPKFGTPERQKLIDEIHAFMLDKSPPVPAILPQAPEQQSTEEITEEERSAQDANNAAAVAEEPMIAGDDGIRQDPHATPGSARANASPPPVMSAEVRLARAVNSGQRRLQAPAPRVQTPADDRLFTLAAIGLTIAIVFLLLKKFMKSNGHGAVFMNDS